MFSADDTADVRRRCHELGAGAFVTKTTPLNEIAAVLSAI
jgi:hypothetical protein